MALTIIYLGVKSVEVNRKQHRITVSGYVEPNKVLKIVKSRSRRKRAEFWALIIPQHLVNYSYACANYYRMPPFGFCV
jgi:hypothetical protein